MMGGLKRVKVVNKQKLLTDEIEVPAINLGRIKFFASKGITDKFLFFHFTNIC